jgi:hypothetical protein
MEAEKKTERVQDKNLIPFKEGESGNPNGRPKGQRNYATIYRLALEKYAKEKGMTAEELEEEIEVVGLKQAVKGNYKFFQDVRDRTHGKAKQSPDDPGTEDNPMHMTITIKKL